MYRITQDPSGDVFINVHVVSAAMPQLDRRRGCTHKAR
jgi:hypothetical protein